MRNATIPSNIGEVLISNTSYAGSCSTSTSRSRESSHLTPEAIRRRFCFAILTLLDSNIDSLAQFLLGLYELGLTYHIIKSCCVHIITTPNNIMHYVIDLCEVNQEKVNM